VILLESHQDFERDFRGDTLHSSILQIMDELGLSDQLLQLSHTKLSELSAQTAHGLKKIADLRHLKTRFPFVAMMPQSRFLDFMTQEAEGFRSFRIVMGATVEELQETDHSVCRVRFPKTPGMRCSRY
jgi:2-polyprenyl-6-methoxyphenol hydroxylase-like FAD-dependent oxidoreductase